MIDSQNYESTEKKTFLDSIIKTEVLKNYGILIFGLFIMSFGVALSVISDLGTTPISCIPNVIKYAVTLSLGMITIIFNLILILIQVLILKSDFEKKQWLQVFVAMIFGYFIDLALYILSEMKPYNYFWQWMLCIFSCFVMGLGVYFEILSNAIILPGEGVSLAINKVTNIEFGKIKTAFDTSNVLIGGILSLLLYERFLGIGLGTIFSGIVVGYIVRFYKICFSEMFKKYSMGN